MVAMVVVPFVAHIGPFVFQALFTRHHLDLGGGGGCGDGVGGRLLLLVAIVIVSSVIFWRGRPRRRVGKAATANGETHAQTSCSSDDRPEAPEGLGRLLRGASTSLG